MGPEDTTDFFSTLLHRAVDAPAEDGEFGALTPMPFRPARHPGAKETK